MDQEKLCLNCKHRLRGRSDKKFCDDRCRSQHNYSSSTKREHFLLNHIDQALKKNHTILKSLRLSGNSRVRKVILASRGFNFNFYTSVVTSRDDPPRYFCYDQGYFYAGDQVVVLVKGDPTNLS